MTMTDTLTFTVRKQCPNIKLKLQYNILILSKKFGRIQFKDTISFLFCGPSWSKEVCSYKYLWSYVMGHIVSDFVLFHDGEGLAALDKSYDSVVRCSTDVVA